MADDATREEGRPQQASDLTKAAVSGGGWRMLSVFTSAIIQLGVSVLLARLLTPADFGTLALVTVVVGIASALAFLGVGPALVQRRTLTDIHIQAAWTLSLIGGLAAFGLVAAGAPLLAQLVGDPSSSAVFLAISPALILTGVRTVSLALLRRRMQFRRLMVLDMASYVLGYAPVAILGASIGWGLWSLVAAVLGQGAVSTAGALWYAPHSRRLSLSKRAVRDLLAFGGGMTLSGIASYLALNGDNFVVGRALGAGQLGLYSRAYYLMNLPLTYFAQVLSQVLLPTFSQTQDNRARMARGYIVSVYLVFAVSAPAMVFLLLAAPSLVVGLYGERWAGAIPPLQVLAVFGALRATYHVGGSVVQAGGRPWSEFLRQFGYCLLVIGGATFGARWGVVGVAWAIGVAILFMYVAMARLSHEVAGFRWSLFVGAHRVGLASALAALLTGGTLRWLVEPLHWPDLVVAFSLALVCVVVSALVACALPRSWRPDGSNGMLNEVADKLPKSLGRIVRPFARLGVVKNS